MGSTGKSPDSNSYENFSDIPFEHKSDWDERQEENARYVREVAERFSNISNIEDWYNGLTPDEREVLDDYVGNGYSDINKAQYNTPWENMSDYQKERIATLHDALDKFDLDKGIEVYRETDFKVFGSNSPMSMSEIRQYLLKNGDTQQIDGFMSFSTHAGGSAVDGRGLIIEMKIPPSVGAGAYIGNTLGIKDESEFLVNTNSVLKYDMNSMYVDGKNRVHIKAEWQGRSEAQTISPTYKGLRVKSKGGKK